MTMQPETDARPLDVESILARHTVARAIYVAPVLIAIFWITRGWNGAWSSALGVAIVLANFLLAGAMLSISAKISLAVYHAAALVGFFLRLGLMVFTVLLIAQLVPIDRIAFGISAVVAYLVLLGWEAVAVSKGRERNLDWTS
jgi:predicted Na+-dependent transporter